MSSLYRLAALVAVCSVLAAGGTSVVAAAPSPTPAGPATDDRGFVDSTARCSAPDIAMAFGSTDSSRVAICKTPAGAYQYRAVRVRDGAKLIVPAAAGANGVFTAQNDGITYTVSAKSLDVSDGSQVVRSEAMTYFHSGGAIVPAGTPSIPVTGAPAPVPTAPLPPPLPAEVGGAPARSAR